MGSSKYRLVSRPFACHIYIVCCSTHIIIKFRYFYLSFRHVSAVLSSFLLFRCHYNANVYNFKFQQFNFRLSNENCWNMESATILKLPNIICGFYAFHIVFMSSLCNTHPHTRATQMQTQTHKINPIVNAVYLTTHFPSSVLYM